MTRPIRLLVVEEALRQALVSGDSSPVFGLVREDEALLQLLSHRQGGSAPTRLGVLLDDVPEGLPLECDGRSAGLLLTPGIPQPDEVEIVSVREDMARRRQDLVHEGALSELTVGLLGAGSVGSVIGLLLAQAGVGKFLVCDKDRLDGTNLSRHACDIGHLGRSKARALSELLEGRLAAATPLDVDLLTLGDEALDRLLEPLDLVVATTDSPAVQFVVNEACVRTKTAAVFVGAYERACGGEIIVVQPGQSPCLYCAVGFRAGLAPALATQERRGAYQAADAHQLTAEPGLAVDITYLASIGASHALGLLDPGGSKGALASPKHAFTLVHGGSVPREGYRDLFRAPFEVIEARPVRNEACPVCGWRSGAEGAGS